MLLGALKSFAGTVIFVSHDRHFISNLAGGVLEMKGGAARYFPGDYEYYLRKTGLESGDASAGVAAGAANRANGVARDASRVTSRDAARDASRGASRGASERPAPRAEEKSPTATQAQRLEDKRLKSALRALEKEEEAILVRLESLEASRKGTEDEMARPEVYADGKRMRELRMAHEENARMHRDENRKWEEVVARITELKAQLAGARQ